MLLRVLAIEQGLTFFDSSKSQNSLVGIKVRTGSNQYTYFRMRKMCIHVHEMLKVGIKLWYSHYNVKL